jgi:hypothetical protein
MLKHHRKPISYMALDRFGTKTLYLPNRYTSTSMKLISLEQLFSSLASSTQRLITPTNIAQPLLNLLLLISRYDSLRII